MAETRAVRIGLVLLALLATLIPMPKTQGAVAFAIVAPVLCLGVGLVLAALPTAGLAARLEAWARGLAAAVMQPSPRLFGWVLVGASLLAGALVSVVVM
jgi:hypothetical protein